MQKIQELITKEVSAQKGSLFLWAPVFFAIGIALYFGLKFEPSIGAGALLSVVAIAGAFLLWRVQEKSTAYKFGFLSALAILLICVGFTTAQMRSHMVYAPMLLKGKSPTGVIGTIESIEDLGSKDGSRVVLNDIELERFDADETPHKIRLKVRKDDGLKVGQRVDVLAGLNPASPPVAPTAFDFQRMMYFEQIGAVGFAFTAPKIIEGQDIKEGLLSRLRQKIVGIVAQNSRPPQQAVITALMTGQRAAIRDTDWNALRASGLAHLLAISGLHVGMVAGVLFFFSRFFFACFQNLALNYPIKKWAALIALVGASFYTLIVGATIPTQRALIMTGLVMVAILFDRSPFSMRLVALAALVVLFFSPESLLSVSFQMSFAAVTALICFYEWLPRIGWDCIVRAALFARRLCILLAYPSPVWWRGRRRDCSRCSIFKITRCTDYWRI